MSPCPAEPSSVQGAATESVNGVTEQELNPSLHQQSREAETQEVGLDAVWKSGTESLPEEQAVGIRWERT